MTLMKEVAKVRRITRISRASMARKALIALGSWDLERSAAVVILDTPVL
ncbi:MAG: hypothetical protein P1T08_03205 [Acidimicrobiia bacterium]|nr:hypothetical protein [Acidimicrobiia bacterium]